LSDEEGTTYTPAHFNRLHDLAFRKTAVLIVTFQSQGSPYVAQMII